MTPAAALAAREDLTATPPRPDRRQRRAVAGTVSLLAATLLTRLLRPDTPGVVGRAVAWSGAQDGKAWFFGTLDPRAATGTGAPAAHWLGVLVLRLSGSGGLVVLSAVLTVLAVVVLARTVRLLAGNAAGLVAGTVLALLLPSGAEAQAALLLGVAVHAVLRWGDRSRWLVVAGTLLGFSVLTGGWTGLLALVVTGAVLVLRHGRGRVRGGLLVAGATLPVGVWLLLAQGWSGGRPVPGGSWSGPVGGVLAPLAATALAVGGVRLWRRWTGLRRTGLVVVLVLLVLPVDGGAWLRAAAPPQTPAVDGPVTSLLRDAGTTWSAAAVGTGTSAALELASGTAVLSLQPRDGATTVADFQSYVATGRVHYLVAPDGTTSGPTSAILAWVAAEHTATTVGTSTVYDLTD